MKSTRNTVKSKLIKTKIMLKHRKLAKLIPSTRLFSQGKLLAMLKRYGMVYVKPDNGSQGRGVLRVEKRGAAYRYQSGVNILSFHSFQGMYQSIRQRTGSKCYVIQKGIHLLKYKGRPFDLRVMIQRNPAGRWEPTGTVGRVAHPRKAVTNGSQGGSICAADQLIKPFAGHIKTARLLQGINRIALLTAAQISRTYPAMNEFGLDIAIDRRLTPWILEVNTRPDPCPFTKLKRKDAINKIIAYGKAYGRRYPLKCTKAKRGL